MVFRHPATLEADGPVAQGSQKSPGKPRGLLAKGKSENGARNPARERSWCMSTATKMRLVFYLLALVEIMLLSAYYWSGIALH